MSYKCNISYAAGCAGFVLVEPDEIHGDTTDFSAAFVSPRDVLSNSPGTMVSRSRPLAVSQNFTVCSALPEARVLPSGEKAKAQMLLVCPLSH
jgi:hypothetical protein